MLGLLCFENQALTRIQGCLPIKHPFTVFYQNGQRVCETVLKLEKNGPADASIFPCVLRLEGNLPRVERSFADSDETLVPP